MTGKIISISGNQLFNKVRSHYICKNEISFQLTAIRNWMKYMQFYGYDKKDNKLYKDLARSENRLANLLVNYDKNNTELEKLDLKE
jgi:hypothetical protein